MTLYGVSNKKECISIFSSKGTERSIWLRHLVNLRQILAARNECMNYAHVMKVNMRLNSNNSKEQSFLLHFITGT